MWLPARELGCARPVLNKDLVGKGRLLSGSHCRGKMFPAGTELFVCGD